MASPRNETVAMFGSTVMPWARASALASPTLSPFVTRPERWTVPDRSRIASRRVVFPLWNGPTIAMHRGPDAGLPLGAIGTSFPAPTARSCPTRWTSDALPLRSPWQPPCEYDGTPGVHLPQGEMTSAWGSAAAAVRAETASASHHPRTAQAAGV